MRVSNIDEFLKLSVIDDSEERQGVHAEFPHVVVVEGSYPEYDVAVRWCWHCFGPMHGECQYQHQYAACPLVLATERPKAHWAFGEKYMIKAYERVARHCHKGIWTILWLDKTDYDYGFGEFCFHVESHKDEFLQQVPNIDWGENYPWLKGEVSQ